MSRWDPKPTPYQRWIVRHRRVLLVVSIVYMLLAIGQFVYGLVTSQLTVSAVLNAIVAIVLIINFICISRNIARLIEKATAPTIQFRTQVTTRHRANLLDGDPQYPC